MFFLGVTLEKFNGGGPTSHCKVDKAVAEPALSKIPDICDAAAPKPVAGKLRLSQAAIDSRLRRVFTPNVKGEFKVSAEIVQQWKSRRKGRKGLEQLFQSVGFSPDRGWKLAFETQMLLKWHPRGKSLQELFLTIVARCKSFHTC